MYNELDNFLGSDTWYTCKALDEKNFFQVLHQVVNHPDFCADRMEEYILSKVSVDHDNL